MARLQDLAPDLMLVTDSTGRIVMSNPAGKLAYGVSLAPGSEEGVMISEILSPDNARIVYQHAAECREEPNTVRTFTVWGGSDGNLRLETTMSWDAETQYFYVVQRNVSAAIGLERSLDIAEKFLTIAGDALAMIDIDGNVLRSNDAFDRAFEFDPTSGETLLDVAERLATTALIEAFRALGEQRPRTRFEMSITTRRRKHLLEVVMYHDAELDVVFLVARDVTNERRLREQLERRASSDTLTDLANRTAFLEELTARCSAAQGCAIVLLDLDDFKEVNDIHGHAAGDALLRVVAQRLLANVRSDDIVARLGGDEFVVLTTCADPLPAATGIARGLRRALAAPYEVNGLTLRTTASIGIAILDEGTIKRPGALLHDADAAMYQAKRTGRNRFVVFDDRLQAITERLQRLGAEIEVAFDLDQIDVDVQSIVNLQTERVSGVEALVRWNHPTHGRLSPHDFIDLVKEKNLLSELTEQVTRRTMEGLSAWLRDDPTRTVSFNAPPEQLRDPALLRSFVDACDHAGVARRQVICEFTEDTLVDSIERTAAQLQILRNEGFRVAIDDFGAGASSLAYFRMLPIDVVKLDRGLISNVPHSRTESTIVRSITKLAIDLGFEVCGEGIEAGEQAAWLRHLGCQFGQGFFLHRPEPIQAFLATQS